MEKAQDNIHIQQRYWKIRCNLETQQQLGVVK
jgi:hypothetical protein